MTNGEPKALRTGGLSGEEISRLQEKLLELLARRTALYTMGESSSIPRKTAEELLRSLCYTLRIGGDAAPERLRELLDGDLSQAYRERRAAAGDKAGGGKEAVAGGLFIRFRPEKLFPGGYAGEHRRLLETL